MREIRFAVQSLVRRILQCFCEDAPNFFWQHTFLRAAAIPQAAFVNRPPAPSPADLGLALRPSILAGLTGLLV